MADEGGSEVADVAVDGEMAISDADADVLITEALRRREEQQSGRPRGRQLRLIASCVVEGVLLIVGARLLGRAVAAVVLIVVGFIIAVALLRAQDLSLAEWGEPAGEQCPGCGEHNLREDLVAVPEASGVVALCTLKCGYAEVRPDPGS